MKIFFPFPHLSAIAQLSSVMALLLVLAACRKDDETPPRETEEAPEVEICIFFAPGELGDQGYADRLLTGMYQLESLTGGHDHSNVQLRYVSSNDASAVQNELRHWDNQNTNPFTRKPYERRLLVITDPILLPMLEEAPLAPTDEVLVINASNDLFGQIPHFDELGPRLHLLSISAAEAAKKLCRKIDRTESLSPNTEKQIWLLQQFDDNNAMADSIGIVLVDHAKSNPKSPLFTMPKRIFEGGITTLSDAYKYAHFLTFEALTEDGCDYMVCGWGGLNVALSSLIVAEGLEATHAVFLDTDYVALRGISHSIVRHYDRAFLEWLQRWLNAPAATMPAREWHGAWDGYVTDDIGDR